MEAAGPRRILVVANRTAATPDLLEEVKRRAREQPTTFALLIPDAKGGSADWTLELALPLLERAAGAPVEGMIGVPEPLAAIQDAINIHGFDELIISTLPQRVSKWLKLDLPSKAAGLGLPVTTVIASSREQAGVA